MLDEGTSAPPAGEVQAESSAGEGAAGSRHAGPVPAPQTLPPTNDSRSLPNERLHCGAVDPRGLTASNSMSAPFARWTQDKGDAMTRFERPAALALLILTTLFVPASAQAPPNAPPGTICVTPQGWCPAVKPGPPGAPCACQTPNGWIQGSLK